jgi:hypothetical protein
MCIYELKSVWLQTKLNTPSLIARRHSTAASIQKLPDSAVISISTARHRQSKCQAKRSVFRSVWTYQLNFDMKLIWKIKKILVFNFTFDLLRTGRASSVRSVAFFERSVRSNGLRNMGVSYCLRTMLGQMDMVIWCIFATLQFEDAKTCILFLCLPMPWIAETEL